MAEEGIPAEDLFHSPEHLVARAYDQRGGRIAFRKP